MSALEAGIESVSASVFRFPTDHPEADGTMAWSETTMIIVEVRGDGQVGIGYTYASPACRPLIEQELAAAILHRPAMDITGCWEAMVRTIRNLGRPGLVSCAISAVDTALWDLKGKLLGLPVSRLLGVVHEAVPVYGTGGFTTYDDSTARAQLLQWVQEWGLPRVKIKIGESWGANLPRDLARIGFARETASPNGCGPPRWLRPPVCRCPGTVRQICTSRWRPACRTCGTWSTFTTMCESSG